MTVAKRYQITFLTKLVLFGLVALLSLELFPLAVVAQEEEELSLKCKHLGYACEASSQCCGTISTVRCCYDGPNQSKCGKLEGESCTIPKQCCSNKCTDGTCTCLSLGNHCDFSMECCSHQGFSIDCINNKCCIDTTSYDIQCTDSQECCQGRKCRNNKCVTITTFDEENE